MIIEGKLNINHNIYTQLPPKPFKIAEYPGGHQVKVRDQRWRPKQDPEKNYL